MSTPPVILVGNFAPDAQQSMLRFGALLERELAARGVDVRLVAPRPRFAKLARPYRYAGWPKLLGYADKFLLFPLTLRRLASHHPAAVFHIVDHANAVYLPHLPLRAIVTCHDLLQIRAALGEIPQQPVGRSGQRYQRWILRSLGRAPFTACVSAKTRTDLLRLADLAPANVTVVPNGLNHPYRRLAATDARQRLETLATTGAPWSAAEPFVLNVGGGQWYKNRPGLLRIFHELRSRHRYAGRLVLVGKPLSAADATLARELGLNDALVFASGVSNDALEALYSIADGLLFPSWEEGFGWPLLEAQACGCRVFTSKRPPMTEVAGDGAVYFDPADPAAAATEIAAALAHAPAVNAIGLANAARFTTAAMVDAYLALYERAARA
ncbi:MAG TPA: glycosyltransferase family 1 protein [Opitutaceae bacterium]|nr:glycosyltransferase family 1 protein [Opitutaceae bacterium]